MKKLTALILILLASGILKAQITKDPVLWNCKTVKLNDKKYKICIEAIIENGWHIYSQYQPKDAISKPTSFIIGPENQVRTIGKMKEFGKVEKQEIEALGISQNFFANKVRFEQEVTLLSSSDPNVSVKISYMACNDQSCLPAKEIEIKTLLTKN